MSTEVSLVILRVTLNGQVTEVIRKKDFEPLLEELEELRECKSLSYQKIQDLQEAYNAAEDKLLAVSNTLARLTSCIASFQLEVGEIIPPLAPVDADDELLGFHDILPEFFQPTEQIVDPTPTANTTPQEGT